MAVTVGKEYRLWLIINDTDKYQTIRVFTKNKREFKMRKALRLYNYLAEKHKDSLFTDRNIAIAGDLSLMSDEEFNSIVNNEK